MYRLNVRVLAFCLAVLGMAVPVFAQSAPKAELSAGYQFLNFVVDGENESMAKGWYFDVAGNLTPTFGLVFQIGGNYKNFEESVSLGGITSIASADLKVHEFLGGVRLNSNARSTIVPFGQVLVGGMNGSVDVSSTTTLPGQAPISFNQSDSGTNFALQAGGGVNLGLTDGVGLRVGADYLRIFDDSGGANLFRFNVGLVFGR
jgi:opacity protein-like surface antigen